MGYLKTLEIDELRLPSNPEFVVRMKRKASYGDQLAMQEALIKINPEDMASLAQSVNGNGNGHAKKDAKKGLAALSKIEVAASMRALTVATIVGWNLTDENDQPMAVTLENLNKLEPEDGQFLADAAKDRLPIPRSEESQRPFEKRSGSRSQRAQARKSQRPGS